MQFLLLFIIFFIFLFGIYKLGKEDFVFMRKNISMEKIFDIAFLITFGGFIFARFFYLVLHASKEQNSFMELFSSSINGLSLTGGVLGAAICLYLISRKDKLPLGRVFDFFSLSFLSVLPILFIGNAFFVAKGDILLTLVSGILYLILTAFFIKILYPRLLSGNLREGSLSILFLLSFSAASILSSMLNPVNGIFLFMKIDDFFMVSLFLLSLILLMKQEHRTTRNKK